MHPASNTYRYEIKGDAWLVANMRIPLIPASDSSRSRSPIPRDPGQPFQMMAAR
jgi:hypothetical protein